jgi:hypothetical protein
MRCSSSDVKIDDIGFDEWRLHGSCSLGKHSRLADGHNEASTFIPM